MLVAWVAYPLVLLVLVYGFGALVRLAAGRDLPEYVRMPCGLALLIAVMDLFTRTTATATLAVPAAVVLGLGGVGFEVATALSGDALKLRRWRPGVGSAAALVTFAVFAAPIVLSGQATWAGYGRLNDTSIWLAIVDQALAHGRTISDLPPATFSSLLSTYLTVGYPIGSFLPLGLGHSLLGEDLAWLVAPWMAFNASMVALGLYGLARRALPNGRPWHAAVIAPLAAGSALLYGYYLLGGIKEMVGAALLVAAAVSVPLPLTGEHRVRASIPFVIVVWALVAALSPGGLVWVAPGGLLLLGLVALRQRLRPVREAAPPAPPPPPSKRPPKAAQPKRGSKGARAQASAKARPAAKGGSTAGKGKVPTPTPRERAIAAWRWAAGLPPLWRGLLIGVPFALLALVLVLLPGGFVQTFHDVLTGGSDLGSLAKPLNPLQLAGIWPTGDFRYIPSDKVVTYALIAVTIGAAAYAFVRSIIEGRSELAAYVAFALTGAVLAVLIASPWIAGKALASASPAIPIAALVAGLMLMARQRVAGLVVLVLIGGGIGWSDALAYHDVTLAPRPLYASLAKLAPTVGAGPTLMTEYSVYGVRHFLRAGAAEDPQDLRTRTDPLYNGQVVQRPDYADLDELALQYTLQYPSIVLQQSPVTTRPASPYQLVRSDAYWQVWQRPPAVNPPILSYLPVGDLGSGLRPGAVPSCANVLKLAGLSGVSQLVAAPAINPTTTNAVAGSHPRDWGHGAYLWMHGNGTATTTVNIPTAGRYSVWIGGSIQNRTTVAVDGRTAGSASDANQQLGQYVRFGELTLTAGRHAVTIVHHAPVLSPGSGVSDIVGPVVFAPVAPMPALISVTPAAAQTLCGRTLSWIDALGA